MANNSRLCNIIGGKRRAHSLAAHLVYIIWPCQQLHRVRFDIFSAPAASSVGRHCLSLWSSLPPLPTFLLSDEASGDYDSCVTRFLFSSAPSSELPPRQIALFAERHVPLLLLLVHGGGELPSPYCSSLYYLACLFATGCKRIASFAWLLF